MPKGSYRSEPQDSTVTEAAVPSTIKRWKSPAWEVSIEWERFPGLTMPRSQAEPCAECQGTSFWWDGGKAHCTRCCPTRADEASAEFSLRARPEERESFEGQITLIRTATIFDGTAFIWPQEVRECHWELGPYAEAEVALKYYWRSDRARVLSFDACLIGENHRYLVGLAGWGHPLKRSESFGYPEEALEGAPFRAFDAVLDPYIEKSGVEVLFDFRFTKAAPARRRSRRRREVQAETLPAEEEGA